MCIRDSLYTLLYVAFLICLMTGLNRLVQFVKKRKFRSKYLLRGALSGWFLGVATIMVAIPLLLLAQWSAPVVQNLNFTNALSQAFFLIVFGSAFACLPGLFFGAFIGNDLWKKRQNP